MVEYNMRQSKPSAPDSATEADSPRRGNRHQTAGEGDEGQRGSGNAELDQIAALLKGDRKPVEKAERKGGDDNDEKGPSAEQLAQLAADEAHALENDDGGRGHSDNGANDDKGGEKAKGPKTLKDAAEALGLDVEGIYALEVGIGDDEPVTLGDLKDGHQNRTQAARESDEKAAAIQARESALVGHVRELAMLGSDLAEKITPEQKGQLQRMMQHHVEQNRAIAVAMFPDLGTKEGLANWTKDAAEMLQSYGYTPAEMNVTDARQVHILRDLHAAKKRLAKLDAVRLKHKETTQRKGGKRATTGETGTVKAAVSKAKKTGNQRDTNRAVAALMGANKQR